MPGDFWWAAAGLYVVGLILVMLFFKGASR